MSTRYLHLLFTWLLINVPLQIEARQEPLTFRTIFGAECNNFFDWQTIGLAYSHRRAEVPGRLTRILSCSEDDLTEYTNIDLVDTYIAPDRSLNPHNNDRYPAYNKPAGIVDWLEQTNPSEEYILIIDPDMILLPGFESWNSQYSVLPGWAASVYFSYMIGTHNDLALRHIPEVPPAEDAVAGPLRRRSDQVSAVVLMHLNDLQRMAPLWLDYSQRVRDDPLAWNETGDAYATSPGMKPWISEMYGYSFGAAKAGVKHHVDLAAMLYPGHDPIDSPLALHYGRLFQIYDAHNTTSKPIYAFRKHWYHGFDPLLCPPWDHAPPKPASGSTDARQHAVPTPQFGESIRGGLFPHPPHPSTTHKEDNPSGLYRELLSMLVPATLNAALCERHLLRCPPSAQLAAHCAWAKGLETSILKSIKEVEMNKGGLICTDRSPDCAESIRTNGDVCAASPLYMDAHCRESCGKCRIVSGSHKYHRPTTFLQESALLLAKTSSLSPHVKKGRTVALTVEYSSSSSRSGRSTDEILLGGGMLLLAAMSSSILLILVIVPYATTSRLRRKHFAKNNFNRTTNPIRAFQL